MLFGGSNPWSSVLARRQPQMQPQAQPPQTQFPLNPAAQAPQYQAPTWPGQTPDAAYSGGLANFYAGQLQNQQVPGSLPLQAGQMPMQPPQMQPPPQQQNDWRNAFHSALSDWRGDRVAHGDAGFADWRAARPMKGDYRGIGL